MCSAPTCRWRRSSAAWRSACTSDRLERIDVTYDGALAEHDTRLLTSAVMMGAFAARSDEPVNLVNARAVAESRGIAVGEGTIADAGRLHEPDPGLLRRRPDGLGDDDRPREPAVAGRGRGLPARDRARRRTWW